MDIKNAAICAFMLVMTGCSTTKDGVEQFVEKSADALQLMQQLDKAMAETIRLSRTECLIAVFMDGNEQVGTAFKIKIDDKSYAYITAGHNLSYGKTKNLSLLFKCGNKSETRKITNAEKLSGIDAALLRLDQDVDEMAELLPGGFVGLEVSVPNYSYLEDFDKRLKWAFVPSKGRIISEKDGQIFFISDVIRPGASGAPIINEFGKVVGVVTGRYLEKNGSYSGVSNGYTIQQVLRAITVRSNSGNAERVR